MDLDRIDKKDKFVPDQNVFIYRLNDVQRFVFEVNKSNVIISMEMLYDGYWICMENKGSIPLDIAKDFANKIIENYEEKEDEKNEIQI